MTRVTPRARRHDDRSGDPLDGLVNMFDIGIVLSLGFLLAALASGTLTQRAVPAKGGITVPPRSVVQTVPPSAVPTIGRGQVVGKVYRLDDGRLVYVVPSSDVPGPSGTLPAPSPTR